MRGSETILVLNKGLQHQHQEHKGLLRVWVDSSHARKRKSASCAASSCVSSLCPRRASSCVSARAILTSARGLWRTHELKTRRSHQKLRRLAPLARPKSIATPSPCQPKHAGPVGTCWRREEATSALGRGARTENTLELSTCSSKQERLRLVAAGCHR